MFGTKTKKAAAVVVAAMTLIGGAIAAYAYFTSTGSGTGSAATGTDTAWTVGNVATSGTMYPGAGTATLTYDITNGSTGHQAVTGVVVTVADDGSANIVDNATGLGVSGCSKVWYAVGSSTFTSGGSPASLPADLAGGATLSGSTAVTMNNVASDQNACRGISPRLAIAVS